MTETPPRIRALDTVEGLGAKVFAVAALASLLITPLLFLFIDRIAAVVVVSTTTLSMAFCAMVLYACGWYTARKIARLVGGESLLCWKCSGEEWRSFAEQEWQRVNDESRDWKPLVMVSASFGVIGLVFTWNFNLVLGFIGGMALFLPFGISLMYASRLVGLKYYRRARRYHEDILIDTHGVYYNGRYFYWSSFGVSVEKALVEPGKPSVLEVHCKQNKTRNIFRVPIPDGHEQEAQQLVVSLTMTP